MSSFATSKARRSLQVVLVMIAMLFAATATAVQADAAKASVVSKANKSACQKVVNHPKRCAKVEPVGHRCIQNKYENTLWALRRAHKLGVSCEADQVTLADGTPVVHHDMFVGRVESPACMARAGVTYGTLVRELTREQWDQLCTKGEHPRSLPTLYQYIKLDGKLQVPVKMEWKNTIADRQQVANWVKKFNAPMVWYGIEWYDKANGQCYDSTAKKMKAVGFTIGLKTSPYCTPSLAEIQQRNVGYSFVVTGKDAQTRSYVREAHSYGLEVCNFDSGSVATWTSLVNAGADCIIAPHPAQAKKWLSA